MSRTYYERPPASARIARFAWDHLSKLAGSRRLTDLAYTPNYRGDGPAWIAMRESREEDTMRWNFSMEDLELMVPSWKLHDLMELASEV